MIRSTVLTMQPSALGDIRFTQGVESLGGLMDGNLKALCMEILVGNVGSERFNHLLLETGIKLDTVEWDVANKILEKADEIKRSLGSSSRTSH